MAREVELQFIDKKGLYVEVDINECWEVTGKKPISTRWVDTDKGSGEHRSRWVARDFKTEITNDYFAATPPWEAVKFLISMLASQGRPSKRVVKRIKRRLIREMGHIRTMVENGAVKFDLIDIGRAHACLCMARRA